MNEFASGVLSWIGGVLSAVVVQQMLNRRSVLSYSVTHAKIGFSAQDTTFGDVQITWKGGAVRNLFLSTVELRNEASRDLQNLRFKTFTGNTILLSELSVLTGTTEIVRHSPEYQAELAVPEGEQPTQRQFETYGCRREYSVPVVNRGQVVRLQYLNTTKVAEEQPVIWLESVHAGVVVKFRGARPEIRGVARSHAQIIGSLVSLGLATLLYVYCPVPWAVAAGCLLLGFFVLLPGVYAVKLFQLLKKWWDG